MTDPTERIGIHLRRRRKDLGLSLEALAEQSGVSAAMLSEVERSVKNPTVRLAWQVARALGCSLTDLLEDETSPTMSIIRAGERRSLTDPETGLSRHGVATPLLDRGLEVVTYRIPGGTETGSMAPNRPEVLEHIVVVSGTLTLVLGEETIRLRKGDHVTYAPQTTVGYRNDGTRACDFLLLSDRSRIRRQP